MQAFNFSPYWTKMQHLGLQLALFKSLQSAFVWPLFKLPFWLKCQGTSRNNMVIQKPAYRKQTCV
jgi:hypothetical protein